VLKKEVSFVHRISDFHFFINIFIFAHGYT
jgi:hypothetical protein